MNEIDYVRDREGLRKMKALVDDFKVVMIASKLGHVPFSVCPMTLLKMDDGGTLWFFISLESDLFKDTVHDPRVQIIYCDQKKQKYLSIFGHATHVTSQDKKAELWSCGQLQWFEGKDDPNLVLMGIIPKDSYYWDNEKNEPVPFFHKVRPDRSLERPPVGRKGKIRFWNH